MSDIKKINHVAIVVENIDEALKFWRDSLGLSVDHIEDVPSQQSQVAFLPVGDTEVELVAPTSLESGMAKYLQTKGGGMHHICFEVDEIEKVLKSLKEKDVRLINDEPLMLPGRKMAFVHPKSTGGVLVELYELID